MRVRIFPSDGTGCGFYRCLEPVRVIRDSTTDLDIDICMDMEGEGALEVTMAGKLGNEHVIKVEDPGVDVIVLQRPAHKHLVEVIPYLQAHGVAVVADFDDDFDSLDPRNSAYRAYDPRHNPMQNKVWAKLASQLADLVTVTTPSLARRYGAHGRVITLPNYVPAAYLKVERVPHVDGLPRLGWTGNVATHPGDLNVMGTAVRDLTAGTVFRAIGSAAPLRVLRLDERPLAKTEVVPWATIEEYPHEVACLDVGVVPLKDSAFNRSKSWLKGLEYAALGVPFVASPTQQYRALERLGMGTVVSTVTASTRAWRDALERLLGDAEYRQLISEEGRIIASALTYEQHAERWAQAWRDSISVRKAVS